MCRRASCLILLLFCVGCDIVTKSPALEPTHESHALVVVASPEKRDMENVVECVGRLEASESVALHAPVDGMLLSVATYTADQVKDFRAGDSVRKGDLLFVIATQSEFYSKWIAAEALKLRAKQRLQELAEKEAGSDRKRETAETPQVVNATNALRSSETELEQLKAQLECVELRAPIGGVVGDRQWDIGSLVRGSDTHQLTTIVALQSMHVHFELGERDLLSLLRGSAAAKQRTWNHDLDIGLPDEQEFSLQGKVDYVESRIDPATGLARLRAIVNNPTGLLYPGMSVRVRIALTPPRRALLVLSQAIEDDPEGSYLWLVNKEDQLEKRYIQPGETLRELRVVAQRGSRTSASDLSVDDRYVVNVSSALSAGRRVQIRDAERTVEPVDELQQIP